MSRAQNVQSTSIIYTLLDRELGRKRSFAVNENIMRVPDIERRIDSTFNDISKCVRSLSCAIDEVKMTDIQHAIRILFSKMLEMSLPDQACYVNLRRKQEREVFVALGGMHLLLRLFEKPFCEVDARSMSAALVNKNSELWNEVLVILREVCYTIPTLSEQLFGNNHIIFFFSLLVHRSVFENSISILEEILAVRIETFSLALVPNLFSLISKFSARHLAHFCRVLSLVLFEPEDRQILEGSQVLRSLELLQLRRDRVAKSSNIVERNQCLIIDMPDLLNRFLTLLRVANYGPNLADLARHNINAQDSPGNADLFQFISTSRNNTGMSEWDHLLSLDSIVKTAEAAGEINRSANYKDAGAPITGGRNAVTSADDSAARSSGGRGGESRFLSADMSLDETMAELLAAFAPGADIDGQRPMDLSALLNVVQIAQSLGLTAIAPDGEPIPLSDSDSYSSPGYGSYNRGGGGGYRRGAPCAASPPPPPSPTAAKKELQFHAMFLNPHHVELLFVLCTLLSGRRKIHVQQKLASLGLADILLDMYGRMSWDSKPFHGHNPMEHIHGPGCDCNPESALRVQYLRLVHNSYDRDFLGNNNKMLLLSTAEKELLNRCKSPSEVSKEGFFIGSSDRGIFTRIVHTLLKEPVESVYRFWLSSCLESFLRGSGPDEQVFIAISGILSYTVTHIVDMGIRPSASATLQTAFDLLGELVKGNQHTIEMVDSALGDTNFVRFMDAVMSNLVDSNVFVRSLYLSIDAFSDSDSAEDYYQTSTRRERDISSAGDGGYLSHTWVQYAPKPLSQQAIDMVKNSSSSDGRRGQESAFRPRLQGSVQSASSRRNQPSTKSDEGHGSGTVSLSTTSSSSSRITHSVRGALQNIREAASHFLTFSSPSATASPSPQASMEWPDDVTRSEGKEKQSEFMRSNSRQSLQGQVALLKENRDPDGDGECDYEEFFTPPEAPHYPRNRGDIKGKAVAAEGGGVLPVMPVVDVTAEMPAIAINEISYKSVESYAAKADDDADRLQITSALHEEENKVHQGKEKAKGKGGKASRPAARLPESLQRFHFFLVQQREYILFRLMITVTMYTINHENICCLNTALLILLLADKRGQLAKLLQNVRYLAQAQAAQTDPDPFSTSSPSLPSNSVPSLDLFSASDDAVYTARGAGSESTPPNSSRHRGKTSDAEELSGNTSTAKMRAQGREGSVAEEFCGECSVQTSSSSGRRGREAEMSPSASDSNLSQSSSGNAGKAKGCTQCRSCSRNIGSESSGSGLSGNGVRVSEGGYAQEGDSPGPVTECRAGRVMVNFRELLWYWREYYLRRGRDRLSIEFSSHIPFFQWNTLVDTLCRDDGSPTALLSGPIALPKSPYHRPARAHNSSSSDFIQHVP